VIAPLMPAAEVLGHLGALVDKSLYFPDTPGTTSA
jgi:hypothetical protein